MKAILLSIRPEWVEKILNREKTIEIRKTAPKCELPIEVYIYCTKGENEGWYLGSPNGRQWRWTPLTFTVCGSKNIKPHGKVVAKFALNKVDMVECSSYAHEHYAPLACLSLEEIREYCNGQDLYAWHISDLVVFDELMELREFNSLKNNSCDWIIEGETDVCDSDCIYYGGCDYRKLTRPPQSFQYVEVIL